MYWRFILSQGFWLKELKEALRIVKDTELGQLVGMVKIIMEAKLAQECILQT